MALLTPDDGRSSRRGRALCPALALALAISIAGCDDRERTNPLDPGNPDTSGRPDVLRARADDAAVDVSWAALPTEGLTRFELWRAVDEADFALLSELETSVTAARDTDLVNGLTVRYELRLRLDGGDVIALPEKPATPGPAVPWVLENAPFGLVRTTPDGRALRFRTGAPSPYFDVEVTHGDAVWVADFYGDEILRLDRDGEIMERRRVDLPYRIAPTSNDVVWVGSWYPGRTPDLIATDAGGIELTLEASPEVRDLVADPVRDRVLVALGVNHGVGVADVDADSVTVLDASFSGMMLARVGETLIVGDSVDHELIAVDLATSTITARRSVIDGPLAMCADGDGAWVVEGRETIRRRATDLSITDTVSGVGAATSIAVDRSTGALFVAVPEAGRLYRLDPASGDQRKVSLAEPFRVVVGGSPARVPPRTPAPGGNAAAGTPDERR